MLVLYLDPFLIAGSLDHPVDVDAGYVDVLFSKSPNIHHFFHLQTDTQWAPPSPVTYLTILEIKALIRAPCTDKTVLPENNLCLHSYEI